MKNKLHILLVTFISMMFLLGGIAEAKRFGGGASFGSKKSYSSPFKKSTSQQKSFSQQKAAAQNQQKKQQFAQRGGLMGMLGGLALGGLLGALFFGGAFEGFNFFDFIVIAGIIFAVFWLLKRKQSAMSPRPAAAGAPGQYNSDRTQDHMTFDMNQSPAQVRDTGNNSLHNQSLDPLDADFSNDFATEQLNKSQTELPGWFNLEEFLDGARSAYLLLQKAWDEGNLEEIKNLTTPQIFSEIQNQYNQQPPRGSTRILQLNAELIDFQELGEQTEAAVMFDNLIAESDAQGNEGRANQVRELWHFVRAKNNIGPAWHLDGIQQIE